MKITDADQDTLVGAEESCPPRLNLSVSVLPDGRSGAVGCPGSPWAGIRVDIKYQVLDQDVGLTALEGATAAYFTRSRPLRHRLHRLAHIPPHLPESFGRDWGSAQVAAGIDAPYR